MAPDAPHVTEPLADLRFYFAAQRTMLAWLRTGIALMAFGFVVARFSLFLHELAAIRGLTVPARPGASLWAGTALLIIGVGVNLFAALRFARFAREYRTAGPIRPTSMIPELAVAFVLAAIGSLLAIYLVTVQP